MAETGGKKSTTSSSPQKAGRSTTSTYRRPESRLQVEKFETSQILDDHIDERLVFKYI